MIHDMDSIEKYMLQIILHQQETQQLLNQKKLLNTQEDQSNTLQALKVDSVILSKEDLNGARIEHGFKWAFMSLIGPDDDTFTSKMFLNIYQLQKQLDKDELQEDRSIGIEIKQLRDMLLQHMGNVKKSVVERTRHQRQYDIKVNKRQMQMQESKIDTGKALDANSIVTQSSGTKSEVQDDSSRSGNDIDADDAGIIRLYDEEPMAEVQLTAEYNIFAIGQHHTEKPEIINEGMG
ncbi:hypothetical protein Tco_1213744 [Tanacetum coccineum]